MRNFINPLWDRWANFHPFLRFVILAVVAGGIALVTVKPSYKAFKSWRSDRNLRAAEKAMEAVKMEEARDLSLTVLRGGEPGVEAYRILEKATGALNDPRHGDIARALMAHPESSPEDQRRSFVGITQEMPLGVVGQAWVSLPPASQKDESFAIPFADRLISESLFREASDVLLGVPTDNRTPALVERLGRVLIRTRAKLGYTEAQRLLAAGFSKELAAKWISLLEEIPVESLDAKILAPVLETLLDDPSAQASLLRSRLQYAANFSSRAAVIDAAIVTWRDLDPAELGKFLADLGLYRRLVETISPVVVAEHPQAFPPLWRAAIESQAWDQAGKLLDAMGGAQPKFLEFGRRALIAGLSGQNPELVRLWAAAIDEAKTKPTALMELERLARDAGLTKQADAALLAAIRLGRGPLPVYAKLRPLTMALAAENRENELMEIAGIYMSFERGNPVIITQYAYLALMNNLVGAKPVIAAMTPLAKGLPKEIPIQAVFATACLADKQPEMAAAALDPLKLDPQKLPPSYRAAFLLTQVLNHRIPATDPQIKDFPWSSLQPSERRKFTEILQSAAP